MIPILVRARDLLARYDVVFCDVWGVLHDGVRAYDEAGEALAQFRAGGGIVVLLSNAPAPSTDIAHVLDGKGVTRDAWDGLVTSGDVSRAHLREAGVTRVFHIGTARDRAIFSGLPITLVEPDEAEMVVATELADDATEDPEDYRPLLARCHARGLPFLCGNPDLVVHVGDRLLPCAGALATIYAEMGGEVFWAGKPHGPAYRLALRLAETIAGDTVPRARILAIGDALRTDMAGARDFGLDGLVIAGGIHREETMPNGRLDPAAITAACARFGVAPVGAMDRLRW